jgi:hypothetical protein
MRSGKVGKRKLRKNSIAARATKSDLKGKGKSCMITSKHSLMMPFVKIRS